MLALPSIVLLAIVACAIRRVRRVTAQVSVAWLACLLTIWACMLAQRTVRRHVCPPLLQQADPLIAAIEAYESAHGRTPDRLDDLVPNFLDAVPAAPFGDRLYRYVRRHKVRDDRPDDRKWALWVAPPGDFMDWSTFRYEPRPAGSDAKAGGPNEASWFTRFGDWIYVPD